MIKLFLLQPMILLSLHFPLAIDHRVIFPPQNEHQTFIPPLNLKEERKIKKRKKTLTPLSLSIISHDKLTKKGSYLIVGRSQNKSGVSFVRFRSVYLIYSRMAGRTKRRPSPRKWNFNAEKRLQVREERRGRKLRAAIPLPRFPPAPLPYFCDPIPTFVFTFSLTFLSASVALHAEPKRGHGDEGGGGKIRVRRIDKVQRGEARRGRYK